MSPPGNNDPLITLPREEFEEMLNRAAERGALRALHDVGLDGEDAAEDIRDLRSLLKALHLAKRTAWQTVIRITTTGLILALIAGAAIKLKLFGGH
jgi:ribulose 1,5-bisphosphate carboxylase large subunit-like protein